MFKTYFNWSWTSMMMPGSSLFKKLLVVEEKLLHLADKAASNNVVTLTSCDASNMKSTPL